MSVAGTATHMRFMDSSTEQTAAAPAAPDEPIDDDGYPTDEALDYLRSFHGSATEMITYVRSLMHNGASMLEEFDDNFGRSQQRLTLWTHGWSGCESVISALNGTMFYIMGWESSHRGGRHTFTFSPEQLALGIPWGDPAASQTARTAPEPEPTP